MTKKKYYVVWEGRQTGIFEDWNTCKEQVDNFDQAQYKSFSTYEEAQKAFQSNYWNYVTPKPSAKKDISNTAYLKDSIAVDAACSGNPGKMEYRGVYVKTGQQIFHVGPLENGTNNIGEFLAIVHALALLKKENSNLPVYSDSVNAMVWVENKKCKTKLEQSANNQVIFDLIDRAEKWLKNNKYNTIIMKWETKKWGEIPADFGRK